MICPLWNPYLLWYVPCETPTCCEMVPVKPLPVVRWSLWNPYLLWDGPCVESPVFSPEISDSIGASLRGFLYSNAGLPHVASHCIMSRHMQVLNTTLYHKCKCVFLHYPLNACFACITKTNWWPWTFCCLKMECMEKEKFISFKFIHEYMWCSCNSTYYLRTLWNKIKDM